MIYSKEKELLLKKNNISTKNYYFPNPGIPVDFPPQPGDKVLIDVRASRHLSSLSMDTHTLGQLALCLKTIASG